MATKEELQAELDSTLSHNQVFKRSITGIIGPAKTCKTFTAATVSKYHKGYPAPPGEQIVLKDCLWLPFDTGALDGLAEQGYTVPNIPDLCVLPEKELEWKQLLQSSYAKVREICNYDLVDHVIVDTASSFDSWCMKYIHKRYAKADNKMDQWQEIKQMHLELFHFLTSLKKNVIVLFHAKPVADWSGKKADTQKADKLRKKADYLPGVTELEMEVTGGARAMWRKQVSMLLPVTRTVSKDGPIYSLHLTGKDGMEGGSRFNVGLDSEQPADLKALYNKIKGNIRD